MLTYLSISFHIYKKSKPVVKSGKVPNLLLIISNIKKTANIVSIFGTSRIFTISHMFTHFFCGHNVRKYARDYCIYNILNKKYIDDNKFGNTLK